MKSNVFTATGKRTLSSLLLSMFVWKPRADLDYLTDAQLAIQAGKLADLGPTADLVRICMSLI